MTKEIRMTNDETSIPAEQRADLPARSVWKRRWMIVAEVLLVLVIVGLLIATWLPALIGARSGLNPGRQ
jgi:hypothetical protein